MTSNWADAIKKLKPNGQVPQCPHCRETRLIEPNGVEGWFCHVCAKTWQPSDVTPPGSRIGTE